MADNSLFQGLPPPSAPLPPNSPPQEKQLKYSNDTNASKSKPNPPRPVLKSALKRTKPHEESQPQGTSIYQAVSSSLGFFILID